MIEPQQTQQHSLQKQNNSQNKTQSLESQEQNQQLSPQLQPQQHENNQQTSQQESQQKQEIPSQLHVSKEQHQKILQNDPAQNLLEQPQQQADPLKQEQQIPQILQKDLQLEQNQQSNQELPHINENLQQSKEQPNEQHKTIQHIDQNPETNQQLTQNNHIQDHVGAIETNQVSDTPEIPEKPSFFQSIWNFFFKPKEVATYPPNFPPPPKENKKTLIFDLDETLIHSSDFPPHPKVLSFRMGDPPFYVFKRPGLDDFLRKYSKIFDIFIFTSGEKIYADPIINAICPYLDEQHRLFRNSCTLENNEIQKDLDAFKRPPTDIIFVEDNFNLKKVRPNNTIIVQRWEGIPFDTTLIKWLPQILDDCAKAKDVRDVISKVSDNWHPDRNT